MKMTKLRNIRVRAVAATVVVLILSLAASMGSVKASNWLGHTAGSNTTVTFGLLYITTPINDALNWNDVTNIEPTDLTTTFYINSYSEEVLVNDGDFGYTGWYGRWFCETWSGSVCTKGWVEVNLYDYAPPGPYTQTEARTIVCHEVGHAVGLEHSTDTSSCLSDEWVTYLTAHDKSEIDAHY